MLKLVDNYSLSNYLGKGQYGKVYQATNLQTKIEVAIKMIPLTKFIEIQKLTELTKNQIQTIKLLGNNINVIKFVEMIKTNRHIYLVYEYCEGGTLEEYIKERKTVEEREALKIFRQLINAMKELSQHNILHRDIKPNNIFFKSDHLKLADFGFCKKLKSSDDLTQTSLGSPLYMAPQVLNGDIYGSKADLWSSGIVLFEMLFGYCPYSHFNIKELIDVYNSENYSLHFPSEIILSPILERMLRRILEKDQFKRISWQDFFYEYEITSQGTILKKDKDFQYDLMKLMKKTSSSGAKTIKKADVQLFKFDWSKITEKNSSITSEQLNPQSKTELPKQEQVQQIYAIKKKLKEFESYHTKMLQISMIIQQLLSSDKDYQYSTSILYFLIYNLGNLLSTTLSKLNHYTQQNKATLNEFVNEAQALHKLTIVFTNENTTISSKINSIKITLMNHEELSKDIFKYPHKSVMRKYLKNYIDNYEDSCSNSTTLTPEGNRTQTVFLLKISWAILQIFNEDLEMGIEDKASKTKNKQIKDIPNIREEMGKMEVSIMLNRILVFLGV